MMKHLKAPWNVVAIAVVALALLTVGGALYAQQLTGNIFGVVTDESGARLPGVTVTLTGGGSPQTATTDSRGEFRFVNLAPLDRYSIAYELSGFIKVTRTSVAVSIGRNAQADVSMKLAKVEAAVTVRAEAPLLETRKVATGAIVDLEQLREIPTARDPWVILQTVPGVLTDRLNIGGNQGGQQSTYVGKGAATFNNVWNLDGVNITDMAATGSTGTYYDFDSFEEINATTGGSDVTQLTPGVQLNLVTKRGTNDIHGSARIFLDRKQWQSHNVSDELKAQGATGGNRIDNVQDYGAEIGGPLWIDRAWLWGAYGRNQIDLITLAGSSDKTTLEDASLKLNLQVTDSTAVTGSYTSGEKIKLGRNASPTHPPETAWNQAGYNGHPSALDKVEVSQVLSSKLFLTASYAYFRGGFQLAPVGGTAVNNVYVDANDVWHNSYLNEVISRPSNFVTTNGSFFFNTGTVGHELKFGFGYRKTGVNTTLNWPGNGNYGLDDPNGNGQAQAVLTRPGQPKWHAYYYNGYAGDTITFGNATINAGLRYDVQYGNNSGANVAANPVIPDILPALSSADEPRQFEWKNWQPRVGVTYAVGQAKKLILKGSYARFADQVGGNSGGAPNFDNAAALAGIYYYWNDKNKDHVITRNELDFTSGKDCGPIAGHCQSFYGFDPRNPANTKSPNIFAPNFKAGTTDEFVAGADYELLPEFVVGAAYTHRKSKDATFTHKIGLTRDDFEFKRTVSFKANDGVTYTAPLYGLKSGIPVPGGLITENRPDYDTTYNGIELTWQKRLSNKWMMRGGATWADVKQNAGAGSCVDPNNQRSFGVGATCPPTGSEILVQGAGAGSGSFAEVWVHSKWGFNVSGLYQLPWGFNFAGNFFGRQGYPFVKYITANPGDGLGTRSLVIGNLDDTRFPNVFDADLRLEKVLNVKPLVLNLSVDVFNVANSGTVLQRLGRVNTASYNTITEIISPRIVRAGVRVSF